MRFDPTKVWPHPVLRPQKYGDDYPRSEFEVEINLTRNRQSTAVKLEVSFELSDPTLNSLVDKEDARFYGINQVTSNTDTVVTIVNRLRTGACVFGWFTRWSSGILAVSRL